MGAVAQAQYSSAAQAPRSAPASPRSSDSQSLQRSLVGLLAQTNAQPAAPRSPRGAGQTSGFTPVSQAPQALGQAPSTPRRSGLTALATSSAVVTRIYTAKKSGTRAEGMALRSNPRRSSKAKADRQNVRGGEAPIHSRASLRNLFPKNSIPRPRQSLLQGAVFTAKGSDNPTPVAVKSKLLTSGIAIFLGGPSRLRVMSLPTGSVIYQTRLMPLSPQGRAFLLQVQVPLGLKSALVFLMRESFFQWGKIRLFFPRGTPYIGAGRGPGRSNREGMSLLRRLFSRSRRKKYFLAMFKKRVRKVLDGNETRRTGKTKTKDLKGFY